MFEWVDHITDFNPLSDMLVFSFAQSSTLVDNLDNLQEVLAHITITPGVDAYFDGSAIGLADVRLYGNFQLSDFTTDNIRLAYYEV